MKIIPLAHNLTTLGVSTGERSLGVHASMIYGDLAHDLYPKRYGIGGKFDLLRLEMGLTFETALEEAFKQTLSVKLNAERPPEQMTTIAPIGVAYSPDLLIFRDTHTALGEIKLTWMTCKQCPISEAQAEWTMAELGGKEQRLTPNWDGHSDASFPAEQFDKWFWQMKFYAYHLGLTHTELYVCFVNADNRPPRPVLLAWAFEFTARELQENNAMLANHARAKGLL